VNASYAAVIALTLIFCCGCQKKAEQPKQRAPIFRTPSASELFDLESKCNAMGQKILENNVIGSALTQSQLSHYNSADNRCYVLLNVSTSNLQTPMDQITSDYFLKDGQTGDILATRYCKGSSCTAMVFDGSLQGMVKDSVLPSETEVRELMEKFVHTDRQLKQGNTP
jgi:hypothetical protein